MRVIDLRSDTVTLPGGKMRAPICGGRSRRAGGVDGGQGAHKRQFGARVEKE